jgi:hypothetical protein
MMTFKTYRIIRFLVLFMIISGVFVWQRFYIDALKNQIEQKNTEIVISQEIGRVDSFEKRWEAIAQEHNDTKDKNVTKEPKVNYDSNTTTIYFLRLLHED